MANPVKIGAEFLVNSTVTANQFSSAMTTLSDGRFVVTWVDFSQTGGDTSGYAVRAQIFNTNGSKAGSEFLVNTTAYSTQWDPAITALSNGGFVITWTDYSQFSPDGRSYDITAQVYGANGNPRGGEFFASGAIDNQANSTVSALGNGRFVVAWRDGSIPDALTGSSEIRAQVFNADRTPAGSSFQVNTTTALNQTMPSITTLTNGNFVVTWVDESASGLDASLTAIRARVCNGNGTAVGEEFVVNTTTNGSQNQPAITALANGGFVAVWTDLGLNSGDMSSGAVRAQVFGNNGARSGPEFLVNSGVIGSQGDATVCALGDGGFVVAWGDSSLLAGDNSVNAVRAQVFTSTGVPSGAEILVNSTVEGYQGLPAISALGMNRFVVTWTDNSGVGGDPFISAIRGQIFDSPITPNISATELFAAEGKLAFMAQLALSAYHLGNWEVAAPLINDRNNYAEIAFAGGDMRDGNQFRPLSVNLDLFTGNELKGLRLVDNPFLGSTDADGIDTGTLIEVLPGVWENVPDGIADDFPKFGLKDGLYTNENAAALVGRSADAIFLSFRGTNDAATDGLFDGLDGDTPDKEHWFGFDGMNDHYALFQPLLTALQAYVLRVNGNDGDTTNDIKTIYVSGHSLGAAMVQAFLEQWSANNFSAQWGGIEAEGVTFANPGYGVDVFNEDTQLSNFWSVRDPILTASFFQNNDGDATTIVHNLFDGPFGVGGNIDSNSSIHSMALYNNFIRCLQKNGLYLDDLSIAVPGGPRFSHIIANVKVINEDKQLYEIGGQADKGSRALAGSATLIFNEILLGEAGDDRLDGYNGEDMLFGGADWDILDGGFGNDTLVGGYGFDKLSGGSGRDVFVFKDVEETNSQGGAPMNTWDRIMDFGVGRASDKIDLRLIDANWAEEEDQAFRFIGSDAFTGRMGDLRFDPLTFVLSGDCTGDGVAEFSIVVAKTTSLVFTDFFL